MQPFVEIVKDADNRSITNSKARNNGMKMVFIMDIQMPNMDGHKATEIIRKTPSLFGLLFPHEGL